MAGQLTEEGNLRACATGADLANARSMFGKLISTVLVLLTVAPFTAPFPTCDLKAFLTARTSDLTNRGPQASALADVSQSKALLLVRPSARLKVIALAEFKSASDTPGLPAATFTQSSGLLTAIPPRLEFTNLRI